MTSQIQNWPEFDTEQHSWILQFDNEEDKRKKLLEYATSFNQIITDISMTYTPSEKKDTIEEMLSIFQQNIEKGIITNHKSVAEKLITHINHTDELSDVRLNANIDKLEKQLEELLAHSRETEKQSLIPINIGNTGEDLVKQTIETEFRDLIVEDTSGTGHKGDLHVTGKGWPDPVLVEVKNYSHVVPGKEVQKFWSDMEECNSKYGVFISLDTRIAKQNRGIDIEKRNGRFAIFASECKENIVNTVIACFRTIKSVSDILTDDNNLEESILMDYYKKIQKWFQEFSKYSNRLDDSIKTYRNLQDKHRKLDKEWENQQLLELKENFSIMFREFPKIDEPQQDKHINDLVENNDLSVIVEQMKQSSIDELVSIDSNDQLSVEEISISESSTSQTSTQPPLKIKIKKKSQSDNSSMTSQDNTSQDNTSFLYNLIKPDEQGILTAKDIFKFSKEKGLKIKYDDLKKEIKNNQLVMTSSTRNTQTIEKYCKYHSIHPDKKTLTNVIDGYALLT